ncbi:vitamin K epoxide reductase family protein [Actinoplanes sp. NEAU-A12]|uniref:Vitamin K epoxide reductase family protein n=1 Tax=Actinoplanes sandaracinus TaxID=3045177 RepID=A0ABT6WY39_9ACTN|nr:vitamin K epoxide reductase family protein [Actinoplanes sandaracinus]MDI6104653.1 vitamin K epoxide reductase family protein [Actinoplanes sandaracinus]
MEVDEARADQPVLTDRLIGWILAVGGLVGTLAAFVLMVEKVALLKDPAYTPSCSINPILSCGSVMTTAQAEVFGFPNPLIGVAAFPVVAATGVAVLAGARLPRWWWLSLQAGTLFGVVFVHWLFVQSLYRIGALCPYCMVVWVVMILVFSYLTLHNAERGRLPAPRRITDVLLMVHSTVPLLWLLILTALIGVRFADYWRTLL